MSVTKNNTKCICCDANLGSSKCTYLKLSSHCDMCALAIMCENNFYPFHEKEIRKNVKPETNYTGLAKPYLCNSCNNTTNAFNPFVDCVRCMIAKTTNETINMLGTRLVNSSTILSNIRNRHNVTNIIKRQQKEEFCKGKRGCGCGDCVCANLRHTDRKNGTNPPPRWTDVKHNQIESKVKQHKLNQLQQ